MAWLSSGGGNLLMITSYFYHVFIFTTLDLLTSLSDRDIIAW